MNAENMWEEDDGWVQTGAGRRWSCFVEGIEGMPYDTIRVFYWQQGAAFEFCPWGDGEAFYAGGNAASCEPAFPPELEAAIRMILPPLPVVCIPSSRYGRGRLQQGREDTAKARLYFEDGSVEEYEDQALAYRVYLNLPRGTRACFRAAHDPGPVYGHSYVDRP